LFEILMANPEGLPAAEALKQLAAFSQADPVRGRLLRKL
jgi:hypothetical protein